MSSHSELIFFVCLGAVVPSLAGNILNVIPTPEVTDLPLGMLFCDDLGIDYRLQDEHALIIAFGNQTFNQTSVELMQIGENSTATECRGKRYAEFGGHILDGTFAVVSYTDCGIATHSDSNGTLSHKGQIFVSVRGSDRSSNASVTQEFGIECLCRGLAEPGHLTLLPFPTTIPTTVPTTAATTTITERTTRLITNPNTVLTTIRPTYTIPLQQTSTRSTPRPSQETTTRRSDTQTSASPTASPTTRYTSSTATSTSSALTTPQETTHRATAQTTTQRPVQQTTTFFSYPPTGSSTQVPARTTTQNPTHRPTQVVSDGPYTATTPNSFNTTTPSVLPSSKFTVQPTHQINFTLEPISPTNFTIQPTSSTNLTVQPTSQTNFTVQPTSQTNSTVQPTSQTSFTVQSTSQTNFTIQPTSQTNFTGQPTSPSPCYPERENNTIIVECTKGQFRRPNLDIEQDEILSTRAEYIYDQSRACTTASYHLHQWILAKSNATAQRAFVPILVTCKGAGIIEVSERNMDVIESDRLIVETSHTRRCQEFFFDFLERLFIL